MAARWVSLEQRDLAQDGSRQALLWQGHSVNEIPSFVHDAAVIPRRLHFSDFGTAPHVKFHLGLAANRRGIIQVKMPVTISDEVLKAAHITEPELKQELALALFQQERLTLAQASRLAGLGQLAFQALMAERRIPIHYGVAEFREDLEALRRTDRL